MDIATISTIPSSANHTLSNSQLTMASLPPTREDQQPEQLLPVDMDSAEEVEEDLTPWDHLLVDAHDAAMVALEACIRGPPGVQLADGEKWFSEDEHRSSAYVDTFSAYIEEHADGIEVTGDLDEDSRLFWIAHQWEDYDDPPANRQWPDVFNQTDFFDFLCEDMPCSEDDLPATLDEVAPRVVHILRRMRTHIPLAYVLVGDIAIKIFQGDDGDDYEMVRALHLYKAMKLVEEEDDDSDDDVSLMDLECDNRTQE